MSNTIKLDRFEATDGAGRKFTIEHTKIFMLGDELYDEYCETSEGDPVRIVDTGTYEVVQTFDTIRVKRVKPADKSK